MKRWQIAAPVKQVEEIYSKKGRGRPKILGGEPSDMIYDIMALQKMWSSIKMVRGLEFI